MGMRRLLLGDAKGKTAWQRLRDGWRRERAEEERSRAFARAYNPLGLEPSNLVEVAGETYEVETVLCYHTPGDDPDFTRYGLKHLHTSKPLLLEAMPEGRPGSLVLSLFELADELTLDRELLLTLENEDVLRHTEPTAQGEEVIDYQKDFQTDAELTMFSATEHVLTEVVAFSYFRPPAGEAEERYLSVEVAPEEGWMSFLRGRRIAARDVLALGTAQSKQPSTL